MHDNRIYVCRYDLIETPYPCVNRRKERVGQGLIIREIGMVLPHLVLFTRFSVSSACWVVKPDAEETPCRKRSNLIRGKHLFLV